MNDINIIKRQKTQLKYIKSVMQANSIIQIQGHQKINRVVLGENCLCDFQDLHLALEKCAQNQIPIDSEKNGKQCKSPKGQNGDHPHTCWTQAETQCLFDLFSKLGSKWTQISQLMDGKTQNCIKNRFYGSLRKVLRRMNKAAKNLVKKFKKQMKFQSITRIIDASEGLFRLKTPLKEESLALSRKIICLARMEEHQMHPQDAQEMIKEINRFNMLTRSYKSQKKISHPRSAPKSKMIYFDSLTRSQRVDEWTYKIQDIVKIEEAQAYSEMNASSTHQQNFLASEIEKPTKQQFKFLEIMKNIEQEHNFPRRAKSHQDIILQQLDMEAQSPLQCEAWL